MTCRRFFALLLHQQEVRLPRAHQRTKGRSRVGEDPGTISPFTLCLRLLQRVRFR
jgi:hypothetical protein